MGAVRGDAPCGLRAGVLALVAVCGCGPRSASESDGLVIEPPASWQPADPERSRVPGTPVAAWTGPGGSTLVVYRALPIPGGTPGAMAEDLANRLANLPGVRVLDKRTQTCAGREAAYVEVTAPGTGGALAPSGTGVPLAAQGQALVPTHRVSVGFPREADALWLVWHYPESSQGEVEPLIKTTLATLKVGSTRLATSSY